VTLLYASMYGNTESMMNAVAQGISDQGVPVDIFDVTRTHVSYILPSLWTQRGVIVGAPTYEGGLFPVMAQTLDMAGQKRIRNKKLAYFGSYGWSGGARRELERIAEDLKWDVVDTLEFVGGPTEENLRAAALFGARFAEGLGPTGSAGD
jgi:flavorubredoxin